MYVMPSFSKLMEGSHPGLHGPRAQSRAEVVKCTEQERVPIQHHNTTVRPAQEPMTSQCPVFLATVQVRTFTTYSTMQEYNKKKYITLINTAFT